VEPLSRFSTLARVLRCQRSMEFIVVTTAMVMSVALAVGGSRAVLWVALLAIMKDTAGHS